MINDVAQPVPATEAEPSVSPAISRKVVILNTTVLVGALEPKMPPFRGD
jgi:hypothetical protein